MTDLVPTPTRLALARNVAQYTEVWIDNLTGESYSGEDGPKVTVRILELERAGLVEVDDSFWSLTDAGREWLARTEQEVGR